MVVKCHIDIFPLHVLLCYRIIQYNTSCEEVINLNRKIILASHGDFAKGLLSAANLICGDLSYEIETYSLLPGMSADDFTEDIRKKIESLSEDKCEYIILTDLYGASVCNSLYQLIDIKNVKLFSGFNLGMLLMILLEFPQKIGDAEAEQIVAEAREGIKYLKKEEFINEEF